MNILVCVRRVPDTSENEIELDGAGNDIEREDLVYSINEWDNYAVEEALQITARVGGEVTVVTVGDEEDEEVLRREMAMGAKQGVLLADEVFAGSDARGIATILKGYVDKNKFDLILTGVQAEDGGAQVGGMPAALLDYPFASLVNAIEEPDGNKPKITSRSPAAIRRLARSICLACCRSKPASTSRVTSGCAAFARSHRLRFRSSTRRNSASAPGRSAAGAKVKRLDYFVPALGKGAEMLTGERDDVIDRLIELMKSKGGLQA